MYIWLILKEYRLAYLIEKLDIGIEIQLIFSNHPVLGLI